MGWIRVPRVLQVADQRAVARQIAENSQFEVPAPRGGRARTAQPVPLAPGKIVTLFLRRRRTPDYAAASRNAGARLTIRYRFRAA